MRSRLSLSLATRATYGCGPLGGGVLAGPLPRGVLRCCSKMSLTFPSPSGPVWFATNAFAPPAFFVVSGRRDPLHVFAPHKRLSPPPHASIRLGPQTGRPKPLPLLAASLAQLPSLFLFARCSYYRLCSLSFWFSLLRCELISLVHVFFTASLARALM